MKAAEGVSVTKSMTGAGLADRQGGAWEVRALVWVPDQRWGPSAQPEGALGGKRDLWRKPSTATSCWPAQREERHGVR